MRINDFNMNLFYERQFKSIYAHVMCILFQLHGVDFNSVCNDAISDKCITLEFVVKQFPSTEERKRGTEVKKKKNKQTKSIFPFRSKP